MNRIDTRDPLERAVREALHADAERAPQLPMEWIGPTTSRVTDDGIDVRLDALEFDDAKLVGLWRRPAWTIAAAAVMVIVVAAALVLAVGDDDPTRQVATQPTTVAQPAAVAQPPVEFTACSHMGPEVQPPTVEQVSLPDGETTIERSSVTYQQQATGVSDPRLEGIWYLTEDNDTYSGPGTDGLIIGTWTRRIENDEGAWQGTTHQSIDFPDGESVGGSRGPYVMIGEGAYAGLTALLTHGEEGCPNERGYIFEGSVPAPEQQTGQ
jgi:hypothetical protein